MKNLPVGISEFSELRKLDCLYIDKTKLIYSLLKTNRRTFLSRPRRFGKSLLVSTLEAALLGHKDLFKETWIEKSGYEWTPYGVIRLDFSILGIESAEEFKESLIDVLMRIAKINQISIEKTQNINVLFSRLVDELCKKHNSIAVLIDEYDYPILHTLHDPKLAKKIREIIKSLSTCIKAKQQQITFVFVTGVSAFTKSGLSSGLNNLINLTLDAEFSTVCGYTEEEVEFYFKSYIEKWAKQSSISYAELKEELKIWYNGYRFEENSPSVYSPFSYTCAVRALKFQNFWFESGTPQFLLDELSRAERQQECNFLNLEEFQATASLLQTFEVENIPLTALLFQMGYLTIDQYDTEAKMYLLKYPNLEVKTALNKHLLIVLTKIEPSPFDSLIAKIFSALREENMDQLMDCFKTVFCKIPYQLHQTEEKFYHAILQALFTAADIRSHAEYSTNLGRADIVLELAKITYIIELKVGVSPENALKQIELKKYYEPFAREGKPMRALGLCFSRNKAKKSSTEFSITYASKRL